MNDYNSRTPYVLPPKDFLKKRNENFTISQKDQQGMETTRQLLVDTFASFGIQVVPGEIRRGPTQTLYELSYPFQKRSISSLVKYEQDIARVTQSRQVRFLLPVPGKSTIGIEIANTERLFVPLGNVIDSPEFSSSSIHIPIPLGQNMQGQPVIKDLTKISHLLVAGNTGSDTSVFIDTVISSFLLKFQPEELRLILVDTCFTTLLPFEKLPHLILPIIKEDSKKTVNMLNWCIREMKYRSQCFAKAGVCDIQAFNKRKTGSSPQENIPEDFPYIVIIIEDLSDLMRDDREETEYSITQLTRASHAAGIHLIVTCQNPTVEVLTPAIKNSLPARISFHVPSKTISHLILDRKGAENLLGESDMLYVEAASTQEERMQGAFISDDEIRLLTNYCSNQMPPVINTQKKQNEHRDISSEDEECYIKCLEVALIEGKVSTSLLQRRLLIGYVRAFRMMDLLESRGIIAPANNTNRPRKVLRS